MGRIMLGYAMGRFPGNLEMGGHARAAKSSADIYIYIYTYRSRKVARSILGATLKVFKGSYKHLGATLKVFKGSYKHLETS